jgi:pilus assembly protein Flp/PilA
LVFNCFAGILEQHEAASNHSPVTDAPGQSTYRVGARTAKDELLILIPGVDSEFIARQRVEKQMHNRLLTVYVKFQNLTNSEQGEDLVEYALLILMLALALITGISHIAAAVNQLFASVSSPLA